MVKKYYGVCKVLGANEANIFFEYTYKFIKEKGSAVNCAYGKDIITETPVYALTSYINATTLEEAAKEELITEDAFIVDTYCPLSEEKLLKSLSQMTECDIIKYVDNINALKDTYAKAINSNKTYEQNQSDLEKIIKKVRRVAKTINN